MERFRVGAYALWGVFQCFAYLPLSNANSHSVDNNTPTARQFEATIPSPDPAGGFGSASLLRNGKLETLITYPSSSPSPSNFAGALGPGPYIGALPGSGVPGTNSLHLSGPSPGLHLGEDLPSVQSIDYLISSERNKAAEPIPYEEGLIRLQSEFLTHPELPEPEEVILFSFANIGLFSEWYRRKSISRGQARGRV